MERLAPCTVDLDQVTIAHFAYSAHLLLLSGYFDMGETESRVHLSTEARYSRCAVRCDLAGLFSAICAG